MSPMLWALALALLAAVGNSLYAYAQRQSVPMANPFAFGAGALLSAGLLMLLISCLYPAPIGRESVTVNLRFMGLAAIGYVLLFLGLYFLYQRYGPVYYSLYAALAIVLTAIAMPWALLATRPSGSQLLGSALAVIAIILMMRR